MKSDIVCYADDTTALSSCRDIHSLKIIMNQSYVSLNKWFESNGLLLNEEKTKIMVFSPTSRDIAGFSVNGINPSESASEGNLSFQRGTHIPRFCFSYFTINVKKFKNSKQCSQNSFNILETHSNNIIQL
ncbi:MAG: hypothetical protein KFE21_00690 [Candidatus Sulcia muelleri]|nr:hypothetical protein [Candidatus Karelsulcia muelleri]